MKAKPVLVSLVLIAAVCLAGCISKTGTGTGNNYAYRADSAPEGVVGIKSADRAANQVGVSSK